MDKMVDGVLVAMSDEEIATINESPEHREFRT